MPIVIIPMVLEGEKVFHFELTVDSHMINWDWKDKTDSGKGKVKCRSLSLFKLENTSGETKLLSSLKQQFEVLLCRIIE